MKNEEILKRLTYLQGVINNKEIIMYSPNLNNYKNEFNELVIKLQTYALEYFYKNPQKVINKLIKEYDLPKDFTTSKKRGRESYIYPRQRAMVFIKYLFPNITLVNIGKLFGGKDHATILYSYSKVQNLCEVDKLYRAEFEEMQKKLFGSVKIKYNYKK